MNIYSFSFKFVIAITLTIAISIISLASFNLYSQTNMKDQAKQPIYFGSTYMTMNNPYFKVINNEIKAAIEANGDVLITLDPALSLEKQKEQINYLIEKKVKLIFLNAVDLNGLSTELKRCKKNNIVVIAVDTDVIDTSNISYTLISNNYDVGVQVANDMMSHLDYANIILIEHNSANSAIQRIKGFTDTIDHDKYKVVFRADSEGQLEKTTPLIQKAIEDNISFNVIMALNDPSALGALATLQENSMLHSVIVYGVDGTPESKALIRDHKMRGSVAQYPILMGRRAAEVAYQLLENKKMVTREFMPVKLITEENINDYIIEGWQ